MIPTAHPTPQPKRYPYRFSRLCTDDRRVSLYFTTGRLFFPQNFPLPIGGLDPHLIHGFPGPPKSSTQTASRSVQPFLRGSPVWQTDRPTDHATRSVRIGRIYVRSTAMRPNNTDGIYPWTRPIDTAREDGCHFGHPWTRKRRESKKVPQFTLACNFAKISFNVQHSITADPAVNL